MSELNKKLLQTPDLNEERLNTLKKLFPDLFTVEGKLNPNELKKIIDPDLVKETERFDFKWFGKSNAKRNAFTPSKATLVYDEERSVNPELADGNMIIEGENLETLKCLLSAYREKVKCIYIDPPYNTGKDFVYSDKWDESKTDYWEHIGVTENGVKVDSNLESSGRFHSNWMNMIYPRLLVARQLLKDDGVIFISIDDNEVHHLRKLCDEVFGEDNFISSSSILCNPRGRQSDTFVATVHDSLVIYAKNTNDAKINGMSLTENQKAEFNLTDSEAGESYRLLGLRQRGSASKRIDRPEMFFPIYICPKSQKISLEKIDGWFVVYPRKSDGSDGRWMWGKDKCIKDKKLLVARLIKRRHEYDLFVKDFLNKSGSERTRKYKSIWDLKGYNNQVGTQEVKAILHADVMSYPKSKELLRDICNMGASPNDIILDFFAGSGTTAHAVMELNREDGGNRKCILVQIPELTDDKSEAYKAGYKKISDITIERNKRVIEKIEKNDAEKDPELFDADKKPFRTGFKVYKLAKSNFPRVEFAPDKDKTEEENIALLNEYIEEKEAMFLAMANGKNIFDEVLLKNGFMLNYSRDKIKEFSKNNIFHIKDKFKECIICMDMSIEKETLKELAPYKEKIFICLERALDTTMKWNLKHLLGDKLIAF